MTTSDPEVIRRQIEDTRRELSYDVDALNEKVNPARVVDRRVSAAKGRMTNLKEKVMGSAQDTTSSAHGMASNAAGSVQTAASSAAGFAGYMVLMFLSIALWWALSHLVGHSWSALIVAVLWGVIGFVAFTMGRKKFKEVNPKPERTVETLQQVPGALKPH
jgi:hypothetical protein